MPEDSNVFAVREGSFDVEFQARAVLAHVAEGLRDGVGTRVSDAGVSARALFGFGDVPMRVSVVRSARERWLDVTYQCGQRKVASEVVRGVIVEAERLGVVRRVRTGDEVPVLGFETGAEVGWLVGWDESGVEISEGCEDSFVAPSEGEAGCEAAREL